MPQAVRDTVWIGVYTGMRLGEVKSLRRERMNPKFPTATA